GFLIEMVTPAEAALILNQWFEREQSGVLRDNVIVLLTGFRIEIPKIEQAAETPEEEEIALFSRFLRGDTIAFNEMAARFHPRLIHFLVSLGFNRELSSDSAYDALIRVLERRERIGNVKDVGPALFTTARNIAVDESRDTALPVAAFGEINELDAIMRANQDWRLYAPQEESSLPDIEGAMKKLSADEELVIRRMMFEGYSASDVARELGRSLQRVYRLRKEALSKLRRFLTAADES
ncbi:MAG: hypothetical protein QOD64_1322, partial [Verrucomicrobiota bacterium]